MDNSMYEVSLDRVANQPVSEGLHGFTVADIEETESANSHNPMWVVTLACLTEAEAGKEARMYLVLTDAARWKFEQFLDAVGAPSTGTAKAHQFVGRRLKAQVTHRTYEGRLQANIEQMFAFTSSKVTTSTPAATVRAVAATPTVTKTPGAQPVAKATVKATPAAPAPAVRKKVAALPADAVDPDDAFPA